MNSETNNRIKLGIFVTTGILLLVTGLYFIGNQQNMFSSTIHIYTNFQNISGLRAGNNVRFSGIDIGTVKNIEIKSAVEIRVEMIIDENLKEFININSIASLGTDGLMGNRLVNIEPGNGRPIEDGDEIRSKEIISTDQMMLTLDQTNKNISTVSEDLVKITGNINKGRGTLYSILMDTTLADELHQTLENINTISQNLQTFSNDLLTLSSNVKQGHGVLGGLTNDSSETSKLFNNSLKNIEIVSNQFSEFSRKLNLTLDSIRISKGTVSVLLYDTLVAKQLQNSMANIDTSAEKLNLYMKALRENSLFRKYFKNEDKKANK